MSHAGEVVLFGGARDPGETPARAALRELCEESSTLAHLDDPTYMVGEHVGQWVTESGYLVDGFTITLPPQFVHEAVPEPKEVDRIGYLPWALVTASPAQLEYHLVHARDRHDDLPDEVHFESPTIHVRHPDDAEEWVLWGLAGHTVAQLQHRWP